MQGMVESTYQPRSIPAYAGQLAVLKRIIPRVRGKQTVGSACTADGNTNRPRACGAKHSYTFDNASGNRIIPARAGQTYSRRIHYLMFKDHPRARGKR